MKWKAGVKVIKEKEMWLCLGDDKKKIDEDDEIIARLMEDGVDEDEELIKLVSKATDGDDISAGFRLAQFVEDYGFFLAEGSKPKVFG